MIQQKDKFGLDDLAELSIGSVLLGFPVAVTEEVWTLSTELPLGRVLFIALGSLFFLAWFGYHIYYQNRFRAMWKEFLLRLSAAYLITLFTSALILFAIDQLPVLTEPIVALKRVIIVTLPASFAATVVDSIHT